MSEWGDQQERVLFDGGSWVDFTPEQKERLAKATVSDPRLAIDQTKYPPGFLKELRITDPDTGGQKGRKRQRMELLPEDTLMWVSEQYDYGAEKYSDRNWEKGYAWSLAYSALRRHMAAWWQGEEMDPDSDDTQHHLQAVVFHALTLATFVRRGIGSDDRPKG